MEVLVYWVISLLFVVALILGLALIVKRFVMPNSGKTPLFRKSSKRRLAISEIMALDHKTRLLLIRRDNVEHLILQSTNNETVIETGIIPPETPPTTKSRQWGRAKDDANNEKSPSGSTSLSSSPDINSKPEGQGASDGSGHNGE